MLSAHHLLFFEFAQSPDRSIWSIENSQLRFEPLTPDGSSWSQHKFPNTV